MTTMPDGVNVLAPGIARAFPNAVKVAGYIDGHYAWSQADWNLFPHAEHVSISVTAAANAGDVLDVEQGDAGPNQAKGWIEMRKAAGLFRPTVYCSLLVVPAVRAATGSLVLGKDYDLWVAHYTGVPHQAYAGCAATQYESTPGWDLSLVHDAGWPHRTPPGAPQPPAQAGWPAGLVLREGDTGAAVRVLQQALHDSGQYGARGLEPVDGVFGAGTLAAVRASQADKHLVVDGIVGPATRKALGV